jgi:hypothetical protein
MIDVLRMLLKLREDLEVLHSSLAEIGDPSQFDEVAQMQALERALFRKVDQWSRT